MKRTIITGLVLAIVFPGLALAQNGVSQGGVQQRVQDPTTTAATAGNQIQNQNQVQNQGEDTQIQLQQQQALQDMGANAPEMAAQRRSQVADAVQAMLQAAGDNTKIGPQVREIAQAQQKGQDDMEMGLGKIQSRNAFARFFVGPDYNEVAKAERLLEQNQLRIQELTQLMNQVTNAGDKQQLMEQIQVLNQVNTQFQNALNQSAGGFSLFGWMFRLFAK